MATMRYKEAVSSHQMDGLINQRKRTFSVTLFPYFNILLRIMFCYVCHYVSFSHFSFRRQWGGQYQENHISVYVTLRFINCVHIYVRTDKFCFVAYVYVDGSARKCICHCLSCEMGFLGARVRIQPSPFRLGLDSEAEVRIIERCINMSLLVQ